MALGRTLAASSANACPCRSVLALTALAMTRSAAMTGVSCAAGRLDLAWQGLERPGIDMGLIVVIGAVGAAVKQALAQRRKPIV